MKQLILLMPAAENRGEQDSFAIRVIKDNSGFDRIHEEWSVLAEESDCHIFQTYEWNRTWWKYFGKEGVLQIVLFYQNEQLIAILPFFRDEVHVFGKKIYSCLRFIGSNVSQPDKNTLIGLVSYSDFLDFIIKPGFEGWVCKQFYQLIGTIFSGVHEIIFDTVKESSFVYKQLLPCLSHFGLNGDINQINESHMVELPDNWENYLMTLSKDTRSHTRRALKKADNQNQNLFEIKQVSGSADIVEDFEEMVEMHQQRWRQLGQLGTFAEKVNYEFHREITLTFSQKGWLQINKLHSVNENNRCIAIDVNYMYKKRVYGAHCAVDNQSEYYKKGPGTVLLSFGLRKAIEEKYRFYDFLRGSEKYKKVYSNQSRQLYEIVLPVPGSEQLRWPEILRTILKNKRKLVRELTHLQYLISNESILKGGRIYLMMLFQRLIWAEK